MSVWFEGNSELKCTIEDVKQSLQELGAHHVGFVGEMPGLTNVELVEESSDSVTIKTNEGVMKRTNIAVLVEDQRVRIELDEHYQAGSKVTATSHFVDEFTATETGVNHHLVISDVDAPGFLGFFYRKLGSSKIGKAFQTSHAAYFEKRKG